MRWADTDSEDSDDEFQTHPSRGSVVNTAMIDLSVSRCNFLFGLHTCNRWLQRLFASFVAISALCTLWPDLSYAPGIDCFCDPCWPCLTHDVHMSAFFMLYVLSDHPFSLTRMQRDAAPVKEEEEEQSVSSSSSSSSSESDKSVDETASQKAARLESLKKAKEEEAKRQKAELHRQRSMSKKEKKALEKKSLDDLDDLLGEFGVSTTASGEAGEGKDEEKKGDDEGAAAEGAAGAGNKKKKKKKGKKGKSKDTGSDEWVKVEKDGEGGEEAAPATVDVAAVLKSKTAKSGKKSSSDAAATAAKEAKAKAAKKAEAEKKKQKKKNKVSVIEGWGWIGLVCMLCLSNCAIFSFLRTSTRDNADNVKPMVGSS